MPEPAAGKLTFRIVFDGREEAPAERMMEVKLVEAEA